MKVQQFRKKRPSLILTILTIVLLACRLLGSKAIPIQEVHSQQPVLPTATPVSPGMTVQEAWEKARPEILKWAADASPSDELICEGRLTQDGRCTEWYGLVGSTSKQEAVSVKIEPDQVELKSTAAVGRALTAPFTLEGLKDSSAIAQQAMAWLEEQGLKESKTELRNMALFASANALRNCGNASGPVVYQVSVAHPDGRICLEPFKGQVTYSSLQ